MKQKMEQTDYKALGFKCGVEIHQQLFTQKKLFCRCPAGKYSKDFDAEVLRHMRPTLSEMGVYDGTALMEYKTKKEIIYRLNRETVCTYEIDDTPPFPINQDALDIVIEIGLLLGSTIVDEMHIARKQYLDGSIPTGFQRTAIVGMGGSIPYKGRSIRIRQLAIEEDSSREISDIRHTITFRTDRLGMPLTEIVTEPDMFTPFEAAEVVRQLGRLMRITGKVRRGIGAVRQDVNVSITGGTRVEIKGVPRYQIVPILTHIEALRQKALLEIKDELAKRGITAENLETSELDVTNEFSETHAPLLLEARHHNWQIRAIKLKGLAELLNNRTQPGKTFAHEISGRVKVIACLDQVPNLYHTDNWPEYRGSIKDWQRLKRAMKLTEKDVAIIVWGPDADVQTACNEIKDRVKEATLGIPGETRQACFDGTTDFERILPGADRMYPDTDHPPVLITKDRVKKIRAGISELPWIREERYKEWGFPDDALDELTISKYVPLIESLSKKIDPKHMKTVGVILSQTMKALKRDGVDVHSIPEKDLFHMFVDYSDGKFERPKFKDILKILAAQTPSANA